MRNFGFMKDGRNYLRNTILGLSKINKPFILTGRYFYKNRDVPYITYQNIHPYVPIGASSNQICDHVNIMEDDVSQYIDADPRHCGRVDYLICRAIKYRGQGKTVRGGIALTNELGIPPVISSEYKKAREILETIPKHKIVDFFTFAEGRYAFYGKNLWVNGHKINPKEDDEKEEKEEKENRGKTKSRHEYDINEFMEMFHNENPIWVPPPALPGRMDGKVFLKMAIPQAYLRKILYMQPSLRKQVMDEFRIMM